MQIISKFFLLKKKERKTKVVILWFLGVGCTDSRSTTGGEKLAN